MNIPAELKYSKSHEWVKMDGDVAVHLDPLVGLGILQLSRDVHGNFLLKIFSQSWMCIYC